MAATQKINRAALDIFILLVLFCAPAYAISLCRTAADALRFSAPDIAQPCAKNASKIFRRNKNERRARITPLRELQTLRSKRWCPARALVLDSTFESIQIWVDVESNRTQYLRGIASPVLAQLHCPAADHAASLRYSAQARKPQPKASDALRVSDEAAVWETASAWALDSAQTLSFLELYQCRQRRSLYSHQQKKHRKEFRMCG